jgi:hypothetical protein
VKARCCEPWQTCYGDEPRGACGYGPTDLDYGQYDCIRACYSQNNDGVSPVSELLEGCAEQCLGGCDFVSEATNELLDCTINGADGNASGEDDCLDVCFPPAN